MPGLDGFGDLRLSQAGEDVRIGYGSGAIFVEETQLADLSAADFRFAPDALLA